MRLDPCWRDLTCMNYHYQVRFLLPLSLISVYLSLSLSSLSFSLSSLSLSLSLSHLCLSLSHLSLSLFLPQTQPVPNPISYYLHQSPEAVHKLETLANHVVELVIPFFLFLPRPIRTFGGIIQVLFQVSLRVRFDRLISDKSSCVKHDQHSKLYSFCPLVLYHLIALFINIFSMGGVVCCVSGGFDRQR